MDKRVQTMTVRSVDLVEQCLTAVMYHLQGSHTSEDSMRLSSRSSRTRLHIPKDFAAAKALSFDHGSTPGSGCEGEEVTAANGSAVYGPTTRRQWSEWVSKTPVTSPNGKENLEVGKGVQGCMHGYKGLCIGDA